MADPSPTSRERLDAEWIELLNEIRVLLPGVQVLFAFLLTVPFSARFDTTTDTQRGVYIAVLLGTALATILLMAPTSLHRLQFRQRRKEQIVIVSHRLTIAGLAVLALAVAGAVFLVTDVVYGRAGALAAGIGTIVATLVLWWLLPIAGRHRDAPR
jgi:predicted neutral ceramidase superfamily lipid hydrolase